MGITPWNKPPGWGNGFPVALFSEMTFGESSSIEEYAFLFGLTALLRANRILEVGTSQGLGAISMALGAAMTGNVCEIVTVDRSEWRYRENLNRFPEIAGMIKFVQGDSNVVLESLLREKRDFDLCLIDGGHDYNTVASDWNCCRKLSKMWVFHDSSSRPGVSQLLSEIRGASEYQLMELDYPPGHQFDDPTGEWFEALTSPGFCLVKRR